MQVIVLKYSRYSFPVTESELVFDFLASSYNYTECQRRVNFEHVHSEGMLVLAYIARPDNSCPDEGHLASLSVTYSKKILNRRRVRITGCGGVYVKAHVYWYLNDHHKCHLHRNEGENHGQQINI